MRKVINFNNDWFFSRYAQGVPDSMPEGWDSVTLPHTWNAIDGQDGGNDYHRGVCYYVKSFHKGDLPDTDRYYLEIKGANSSAEVYLNGRRMMEHHGGYSTWRVDLSEAMDEENFLVIAVDNSPNDKVYPQMADFTFYGGLYRDVNLICVGDAHFDLGYYGGKGLTVTPTVDGRSAHVEMAVNLSGYREGMHVRYEIFDKNGLIAFADEPHNNVISLDIPSVMLWQGKKDPYLYTARATLMLGEESLDQVSTRFGCRTFDIDPDKGFILNGEPYPLRGVSRHQDRWGKGNALSPEDHREDMELISELGANTIRLAHYQHDEYFYDLCDEYGMVVWAEIPYISKHMPGGRDNTLTQMKELIVQNYNHPSIVVWGLSNEITMSGDGDPDMIDNHKVLNDLVHRMDRTRKTVIACVSMCSMDSEYIKIPDAVSYNHYFGWYGGETDMNGPWFDRFHEKHPDIPIGCSEYGCEALNWHTSNPTQGDYTEEYQAYYHEELIKQLFPREYIWATHVWNMFDFGADARNEGGENGQNHKGLVTFDRKYKKDAFYAYKAWLSDEPFVHICGKRYIDRVEAVTRVTVYSNQPCVELFANGVSLGKKESAEHFFYYDVPLEGTTELIARAGKCMDGSVVRKVDKFNEAYRLREVGAVLNWFDITEREGYFSLNDKLSDIMKAPGGAELFAHLADNISGSVAGFELGEEMMQMMGGFTVLRLTNLMGTAGAKFTKEELLSINEKLNQIKKP